MPSRVHNKKSGYYNRKGGAYKRTWKGGIKKVGSGEGSLSKRDPQQDAQRSARQDRKMWDKYPQHYDKPRSRSRPKGSKVWVKAHTRKDGTRVKGHYRKA